MICLCLSTMKIIQAMTLNKMNLYFPLLINQSLLNGRHLWTKNDVSSQCILPQEVKAFVTKRTTCFGISELTV